MNDKIIQEKGLVDVQSYLDLQNKVVSMAQAIVSLSKIVGDQGDNIIHMLEVQDKLMKRAESRDHDYELLAARFKTCSSDELK